MKITKRKGKKKRSSRKSNPLKGRVKMAKRRKRRTYHKKRRSNPANPRFYKKAVKRRRRKRNPSTKGVMEILINGAIAGVGAVASSYLSGLVYNKFVKGTTPTAIKQNLTSIATAVALGWAATKFVKGEKGKMLAAGAVAGAVAVLAKNTLGLGEDSNVNTVLDNLLGAADISGASDMNSLLGEEMILGDDLLLGYDDLDGEDEF